MSKIEIKKAVRQQKKIRINVVGPSGAGKSHTALNIMNGIVGPEGRILVIDSEHGRASFFADIYEFDTVELPDTSLDSYFEAINLSRSYDGVIIDSLSHAWESLNEEVNKAALKNKSGNTFQMWGKTGNPLYAKLFASILTHPGHVIVTMRVKSDYSMEEYVDSNNRKKTKPVKIGLAPKFREGGEYEFDIVGNLDMDHNLIIEKVPPGLGLDGAVINKPGKDLGEKIAEWLSSGVKAKPPLASVTKKTSARAEARAETAKMVEETWQTYLAEHGNPWLHIFQGDNNHIGKAIAALPETELEKLTDNNVTRLFDKGKLTREDVTAIGWCFDHPELRMEAMSTLFDQEQDQNKLLEGEQANADGTEA